MLITNEDGGRQWSVWFRKDCDPHGYVQTLDGIKRYAVVIAADKAGDNIGPNILLPSNQRVDGSFNKNLAMLNFSYAQRRSRHTYSSPNSRFIETLGA